MAEALARDGRLLEVEVADFGLLFPLFDAFIVRRPNPNPANHNPANPNPNPNPDPNPNPM